jgi:hypothetical protein
MHGLEIRGQQFPRLGNPDRPDFSGFAGPEVLNIYFYLTFVAAFRTFFVNFQIRCKEPKLGNFGPTFFLKNSEKLVCTRPHTYLCMCVPTRYVLTIPTYVEYILDFTWTL